MFEQVTNGLTFSIYATASGGTVLWTETHSAVTVTHGLFNVLLGSVNPIDADYLNGESYLGIQVGAASSPWTRKMTFEEEHEKFSKNR